MYQGGTDGWNRGHDEVEGDAGDAHNECSSGDFFSWASKRWGIAGCRKKGIHCYLLGEHFPEVELEE